MKSFSYVFSSIRKSQNNLFSLKSYPLLFITNAAIVVSTAGFIYSSRPVPVTTATMNQSSRLDNTSKMNAPIDELSSADVAVNVAQLVGLDEVTAVINHADSKEVELLQTSEDSTVIKPQIVSTEAKSVHDVIEYVTVDGDTLQIIADKHGVSVESIKWSNGLPSGAISAGKTLTIPPIEGIVYTVKAGDTPEALAEKYKSDQDSIRTFNDAELSGLVEGTTIVIPDGKIQAPPAYRPIASGAGFRAVYGPANGYDWGWCTWHAANRRIETGNPLPRNLGNANTWSARARAAGFTVSDVPVAGAVVWHDQSVTGYVAGGLGHVAYVEAMNADGSILVSDMNSRGFANSDLSGGPAGGWSRVSYRIITPDQFIRYDFIY